MDNMNYLLPFVNISTDMSEEIEGKEEIHC